MLKPSGKTFISIHTHTVGEIPYIGTEERIDIRPAYFLKMVRQAGLSCFQEVGPYGGQDVFILEKAP